MSKRLVISGPFYEKTGNPSKDNPARRVNRSIHRGLRRDFRIIAKSRKRRRKLFHIEGDKYQHLMATVMNGLITRRATSSSDGES